MISPSSHTLSHSLDILVSATVINILVLSSSFGSELCLYLPVVHVLLRYLDIHEVVNVVKYFPTFIRWSCQCASCAHPFCLDTQCRPLYTAAALYLGDSTCHSTLKNEKLNNLTNKVTRPLRPNKIRKSLDALTVLWETQCPAKTNLFETPRRLWRVITCHRMFSIYNWMEHFRCLFI